MTHLVQVNPLLFEPGERLTVSEFLDRWEQMPGLKSAELIDGVVHLPSPVSLQHAPVDGNIHTLLCGYAASTGVCRCLPNATWLMMESAPQPDVVLRLLPEFGGQTRPKSKLVTGPPEMVVEVCGSSRSFDLGPKLALYQRAGVQEYLALLLEDQRAEWRMLEDGHYRVQSSDSEGIIKSLVFPGLWLDEHALWTDNPHRLQEVLTAGLKSNECTTFLERLQGRS